MTAAADSTDRPETSGPRSGGRRPVGDLIVRAGALATALAAIVGLGVLVWNLVHKDDPPRGVRVEQLDLERGISFGDFKGELELASRPPSPEMRLASQIVAQTPDAEGDEAPTSTPTDSPSPTSTPSPSSTPVGSATPGATADPVTPQVQVQPSSDPGALVLAPVGEATQEATVELPSGCEFRDAQDHGEIACANAPAMSWATTLQATQTGENPRTQPAVVSAKRFLRVLRDTRRRTVSRGGKRFTEPIGVAVSLAASLKGYRGKHVQIRWSLHRGTSGKASSRAWLVNRRVVKQKVEHDAQPITAQFWVPLPRHRADSFIRVTLYSDGQLIAYRNTPHFR